MPTCPAGALPEVAVFMLAGVDLAGEEEDIRAALEARDLAGRVVVGNDTFAVLRAGATSGWGIAITCGAGINCVGLGPAGASVRYPALGALTGDWGGGYDLGEAALGRGGAVGRRTRSAHGAGARRAGGVRPRRPARARDRDAPGAPVGAAPGRAGAGRHRGGGRRRGGRGTRSTAWPTRSSRSCAPRCRRSTPATSRSRSCSAAASCRPRTRACATPSASAWRRSIRTCARSSRPTRRSWAPRCWRWKPRARTRRQRSASGRKLRGAPRRRSRPPDLSASARRGDRPIGDRHPYGHRNRPFVPRTRGRR